ncbi:MAG: hypothetical protein G5701_05570 [Serratia symbiotica]|nr:hypothetical protein [Serratia symbiotica]
MVRKTLCFSRSITLHEKAIASFTENTGSTN